MTKGDLLRAIEDIDDDVEILARTSRGYLSPNINIEINKEYGIATLDEGATIKSIVIEAQ